MADPCIWLTRPAADSSRLAESLAELGIATVIAPVMEIEHCVLGRADEWSATSASPIRGEGLTARFSLPAAMPQQR